MNCPYCNNEVPVGSTHCPSCGGSVANNAPASISASPVKSSIPTTYAWILALLPIIMWMALILIQVGILSDDVSDDTADTLATVVFWIGAFLSFGLNYHLLQRDEKLLAGDPRCEEMRTFRRIGIFFPPVYLCVRAAKIDNHWAYAIVGSILGFLWWLIVLA